MQTELRNHIDGAKWMQAVKKMEAHLCDLATSAKIPPNEQMLYHRLRQNLLAFIAREGLTL